MRRLFQGIVIVAISTSFVCGPATAQTSDKKYPKNLFALSALHFDASRNAHGPDWYLSSNEGKAALGAIATALGVAPVYVAMASAAVPPATTEGAQTNYKLPLAAGYVPCAARITVQTIVPASGSPFSTINAAINPTEIQMTTVTPVLGIGQGRSMAEGDILYYGILPQFLKEFTDSGTCKPVTAHVFLYTCTSRAACNTPAVWGSPSAAARTIADL